MGWGRIQVNIKAASFLWRKTLKPHIALYSCSLPCLISTHGSPSMSAMKLWGEWKLYPYTCWLPQVTMPGHVKMLPMSDQGSITVCTDHTYWHLVLHIRDSVLCGNDNFEEKTEFFQIGPRHWNTQHSQPKEIAGVITSERWSVLSAGQS